MGLGLCQDSAVAARIDDEQHIALVHLATFGVGDALNVAGDARAQFNGFNRINTAVVVVHSLTSCSATWATLTEGGGMDAVLGWSLQPVNIITVMALTTQAANIGAYGKT